MNIIGKSGPLRFLVGGWHCGNGSLVEDPGRVPRQGRGVQREMKGVRGTREEEEGRRGAQGEEGGREDCS